MSLNIDVLNSGVKLRVFDQSNDALVASSDTEAELRQNHVM
jgi:hypothetical protein